ncbi:MAG: menaquinone biosynthesis protein [Desulfovibrio sp.]|jgi:chorismate dehydratase|nr:menaquinone biosynthesis protein [Desulfovibrio sp.]
MILNTAGTISRKRMGRIAFLNVLPVYHALESGIIQHDYEIISAAPAELNRRMAEADLLASSVSCVEYARRSENYLLLSDLSISSDGPVRSVLFLSRTPLEDTWDKEILLSSQSHTSVLLLRMLLREVYGVEGINTCVGRPGSDIEAGRIPDAFLAIGDEALRFGRHPAYPHRLDLGEVWKKHTGLPFVFGLWIARRDAGVDSPGRLLRASRDWGLSHREEILRVAGAAYPYLSLSDLEDYFSCLEYSLGERELAGLELFWQKLAAAGEIAVSPELVFDD